MSRRPSEKHLITSLEASIFTLKSLVADLPELLRRREHEAEDGYPSQSMGGAGGQHGTVSDPTGAKAISGKMPDSIGDAIDEIVEYIGKIGDQTQTIRNYRFLIFSTGESQRGRQPATRTCHFGCVVTGYKEDRIISGYCRSHYDRWIAWRDKRQRNGADASPIAFRAEVNKEIEEQSRKRVKK